MWSLLVALLRALKARQNLSVTETKETTDMLPRANDTLSIKFKRAISKIDKGPL